MKDVIYAMAWDGFVGILKEVWHRLCLCDGQPDYFGRRLAYPECPSCRKELEEIKQQKQFATWDAMGLGYVGPGG